MSNRRPLPPKTDPGHAIEVMSEILWNSDVVSEDEITLFLESAVLVCGS